MPCIRGLGQRPNFEIALNVCHLIALVLCEAEAERECARAVGVGLPERVARAAKRSQEAARSPLCQASELESKRATMTGGGLW